MNILFLIVIKTTTTTKTYNRICHLTRFQACRLVRSHCCATDLRNFFHLAKLKLCVYETLTSILPSLALGNDHSVFCRYEPMLDTACKQNHTARVLLRPPRFTLHHVLEFHPRCSMLHNLLPF